MTDLELELRDLAAHLDVPPAPPFSGAVLRASPAVGATVGARLAVAIGVAAFAMASPYRAPVRRCSGSFTSAAPR